MIKHIVMFKFKDEAEGKTKRENAVIAKNMLDSLLGKVPSLLSIEVGINADNASQTNFDLVLTSTHNDLQGLNDYAVHPEHLEVAKFIKSVIVDGGRACVDYEY